VSHTRRVVWAIGHSCRQSLAALPASVLSRTARAAGIRLRAQDTPSCASGTNGVSRRDHDPNADHRNLVEVIISTLGSHRTSARVSYLSVSDRCPYANLRDCPMAVTGAGSQTPKPAEVVQTEASSGVDSDAEVCPTERRKMTR